MLVSVYGLHQSRCRFRSVRQVAQPGVVRLRYATTAVWAADLQHLHGTLLSNCHRRRAYRFAAIRAILEPCLVPDGCDDTAGDRYVLYDEGGRGR